ncbi:hypothetical protein MNBD_GAMMA12-220 [hydrothermal vent metagenome]|uniref:Glycosyltransferase 2-like domain-containing protein n=1 Tax=hydrothermal vent metagenome TaxID=652676 RepID=A0A3B0YGT6_9ZZZZ
MIKKRSFLVIAKCLSPLMKDLVVDFGVATYREELVIHFLSEYQIRMTITEKYFSWASSENDKGEKFCGKEFNSIGPGISCLKEKILVLCDAWGDAGVISLTKVYRFQNNKTGLGVEIRQSTAMDSVLSIFFDPPNQTAEKSVKDYALLRRKLSSNIKPCSSQKEATITANSEDIVYRNICDEPLLSSKILGFCHRNGISMTVENGQTYREAMLNKDNDYGHYESVFQLLTNINLLSANDHYQEEAIEPVSIIIPFFNSESSILKTLSSIENQKINKTFLANCEVILIDDGSRLAVSETVEIDLYSFDLIIVRLEENCGVSNARSIGVAQSSYEILIFLDSDVILSEFYLMDHIVRHHVLHNIVLVSFKKNVHRTDPLLSIAAIQRGIRNPDCLSDLRIATTITASAVGSYDVDKSLQFNILEETNFFKNFHGSRIFGVYDLSCMVTGHNFSCNKNLIDKAAPFSNQFKGWGMEDVYFGLKTIAAGAYIIPVLSSGVYHIKHTSRTGTEDQKQSQYKRNVKIINQILDTPISF